MEAPNHSTTDPSILLVNEIEILLAQTRLMELYLKQAQATAANERARLQEQYVAELALLRAQLQQKEQELQKLQRSAEPNRELAGQVQELGRQLEAKNALLSNQASAVQRADDAIAALGRQIASLEADNQAAGLAARESAAIRETLRQDVAALSQELEKDRQEYHRQLQAGREIESGLRGQLEFLQQQISETSAGSLTAANHLQQAQDEIAGLRQRIAALRADQQEQQASAARELEQARVRFEVELSDLRAGLTERDESLQHSQRALVQVERGLRSELITLRSVIEQKQLLVENRERDLSEAQAQIAALQQRIASLLSENQNATAASAELAQARKSFSDELAELQHQVEVKERELMQRQEAVSAVELSLHSRIQALQQELSRNQNELSSRDDELQSAHSETAHLRQRIEALQTDQALANEAAQRDFAETRRQLENDLSRLHSELVQKESALAEQQKIIQSLQAQLGGEIDQLRGQLEQEQSAVDRGDVELAEVRAALAVLHERNNQLEWLHGQAAQSAEQANAGRADIAAQLDARENQLRQAQNAAAEQEQRLNDQLNHLQGQVNEKQHWAESRGVEIDRLRGDLNHLSDQLNQRQQAHEGQLAEAHANDAKLRDELNQLRGRASEAESRAIDREQTIESLRSENAALSGRTAELEAVSAREQNAGEELTAVRSQLETELATVRHELQQKAWSLAQQQAAVENLALAHRGQIDNLKAQLNEQHHAIENRRAEMLDLQSQAESWQQRASELETAVQRIQANADHQAEQTRQEYGARIEALSAQLEARAAELLAQNQAHSEVERSLQNEIARQSAAVQESQQLSSDVEPRLAGLQAELQQKAAELARQQSEIVALTEAHRSQVAGLEVQLQEQHQAAERQLEKLLGAQLQAATWRQKAEEIESAAYQSGNPANPRIEQITQEYQARIDDLNAQIAEKSKQLAVSAAAGENLEQSLRAELARFRTEAREKSEKLDGRDRELQGLTDEAAQLRQRFAQLESQAAEFQNAARAAAEAKSALESDLSVVRQELQQRTWALAQQQASVETLSQTQRNQIKLLETKIAEQLQIKAQRDADSENSRNQLAALEGRLEELQSALQHAELAGISRAEQVGQEYRQRIDQLSAELERKNRQLSEHSAGESSLEQSLRAEIARLTSETRERNQVLQSRNDELVRVKNEKDSMLERVAHLETASVQNDTAASAEIDRMRGEFQAQLALLQAELSQKEWTLEERQAVASGREQDYRQQIEALRRQLTLNQSDDAPPGDLFVMGQPKLSEDQSSEQRKFAATAEPIQQGGENDIAAATGRRWRTGLAWKRRWKS